MSELLTELTKLYGKHPAKRDEFGRRPALPSEVQRVVNPAQLPEVRHEIRHTPHGKPGTDSGKS